MVNSYAELADLKSRLKSVYDNIYEADDEAICDLEAAASEINGMISNRYLLPITNSQAIMLLKDWQLTLTEEKTYSRGSAAALAENVKSRVDLVRKYLGMVMVGEFKLVGVVENSIVTENIAVFANEKVEFSRDKLKDY